MQEALKMLNGEKEVPTPTGVVADNFTQGRSSMIEFARLHWPVPRSDLLCFCSLCVVYRHYVIQLCCVITLHRIISSIVSNFVVEYGIGFGGSRTVFRSCV
jgi:hypothetical protein